MVPYNHYPLMGRASFNIYIRGRGSFYIYIFCGLSGCAQHRIDKYQKQLNDEYYSLVKKSKRSLTLEEAYDKLCEKYWPKIFAEFQWRVAGDQEHVRIPHSGKGAFGYATTEVITFTNVLTDL